MTPRRPYSFTVNLDAPLTRHDVPRLCHEATQILAFAPVSVVRCDVGAVTEPDGESLDAVARLALAARRFGAVIELHNACSNLLALVDLAGLGDVMVVIPRSGVEMRGQPEDREEGVGVEEEVEPDDLAF